MRIVRFTFVHIINFRGSSSSSLLDDEWVGVGEPSTEHRTSLCSVTRYVSYLSAVITDRDAMDWDFTCSAGPILNYWMARIWLDFYTYYRLIVLYIIRWYSRAAWRRCLSSIVTDCRTGRNWLASASWTEYCGILWNLQSYLSCRSFRRSICLVGLSVLASSCNTNHNAPKLDNCKRFASVANQMKLTLRCKLRTATDKCGNWDAAGAKKWIIKLNR